MFRSVNNGRVDQSRELGNIENNYSNIMLTIISNLKEMIKGRVGIRAGGWKIFQRLISGGGTILRYSGVSVSCICSALHSVL